MDYSPKQEKIKKQRKKTRIFLDKKRRRPTKFRKENTIIKKIASERIEYLMEEAVSIYSSNPYIANRYVALSRNYSMSAKVDIPDKYKRLICKKCKKLMIPGISSRIRLQSRKKKGSRLVKTCLNCSHSIHIYYKNQPEQKRES